MRYLLLVGALAVGAVLVALAVRKRRVMTTASAAGGATASEPIVRVRVLREVSNPAFRPAPVGSFNPLPRTTWRPDGTRDYPLSQIPYPSRIDQGLVWSVRTGRGGEYEGAPVREIPMGGVERWAVHRRGAGGSAQAAFAAVIVVGAAVATAVGGPAAGAAVGAGGAALARAAT